MTRLPVFALATTGLILFAGACESSGGGPRKVRITQNDDGCTPASISVTSGETLDVVVSNNSSRDAYEFEGIDGTNLEEFVVHKGETVSVGYAVPAGAATHKLKCYVPAGPSTIIELVASGGGSPGAAPSEGIPATSEPPLPHADPDPEATHISEVALDIEDFHQGTDEQTFTVTNQSGFPVDLGGWSVVTRASAAGQVSFPSGLVLAPRQSITVHTKAGTNSSTDVYLALPRDVAPHVYTPGDPDTGFIDIVSNEEPGYFRYVLPAGTSTP